MSFATYSRKAVPLPFLCFSVPSIKGENMS